MFYYFSHFVYNFIITHSESPAHNLEKKSLLLFVIVTIATDGPLMVNEFFYKRFIVFVLCLNDRHTLVELDFDFSSDHRALLLHGWPKIERRKEN